MRRGWTHQKQVKVPYPICQQSYLTRGGFVFRGFVYFAVWLALMLLFNTMSRQQDVDQRIARCGAG